MWSECAACRCHHIILLDVHVLINPAADPPLLFSVLLPRRLDCSFLVFLDACAAQRLCISARSVAHPPVDTTHAYLLGLGKRFRSQTWFSKKKIIMFFKNILSNLTLLFSHQGQVLTSTLTSAQRCTLVFDTKHFKTQRLRSPLALLLFFSSLSSLPSI